MVLPERVKEMFRLYGGPKNLLYMKGTHESARLSEHIEMIFRKIEDFYGIEGKIPNDENSKSIALGDSLTHV